MSDMPKSFPHPLYEKYVLKPFYDDAKTYYYEPMLAANKAHTVMLYESGIITQENASALLSALKQVEADGLDKLSYQSGVEDLFFAIERRLIELVGPAYGGNLQLARSRNDLGYALTRLALRPLILESQQYLLAFRRTLLAFAREHLETLMPGYTHTQPAQPSTMAHYIAGVLSFLQRDAARFQFAYDTNNQSPLGAAALTGTGFPINRQTSADLLGFDAIMASSYDSIGSSDNLTDVGNALTSLGVNMSRVVHDMLFWATQESGAVRIHDSFIQISSIMPQKRNPVVLEHLRARISRMMAQAQGIALQCHSIPFGDTQDIEDEIFPLIFGGLHTSHDVLDLYEAVVSSLHVNVEHLRERAMAGFTTVTELADTLVREANLPFRQAHSIVSGMVTYALENKIDPADLNVDILKQVAQDKIGQSVELSEAVLQQAIDPVAFVAKRVVYGGVAPSATAEVLDEIEAQLQRDEAQMSSMLDKLSQSDAQLKTKVDEIIS
ncbi:MAG: argininosuccinate lyase [Anaerolineaceae bacterium]|nr:argininosuccinate lyase [Anaerolineaceae bacterium]